MSESILNYPVEAHLAPELSYGAQCVDLGVLLAQGHYPSLEDIMVRYRLTLGAAYRRYHLMRPKPKIDITAYAPPARVGQDQKRQYKAAKKNPVGSFTPSNQPDTVCEKESAPCL